MSVDKDSEKWKNSVKKNNLNPENSFLLVNGYDLELKSRFGIDAIPRYVIIDSEGNALNEEAPKPSDPELGKELSRWLNGKTGRKDKP